MKSFLYTIATIFLFASCGTYTAKFNKMEVASKVDSVGSDYTANATGIEEKKQEMLSIADSVGHFWFSDDTELQSQDPHAFWLMNRMMNMVQLIQTADDCWAWTLAMNESVVEYNSRLDRKIGSVDAACKAIETLINIYNGGNQPMLNTASYVESILMHYRATYAYYRLIEHLNDNNYNDESDWDVQMRAIYYREFKAWFDINNAMNGIMSLYTYVCAGYSGLPMDMNGTFEFWSKDRLAELEIEQAISWSYGWKPYESDAKTVSSRKFGKLLDYFKSRTKSDVVEESLGGKCDKNAPDYEYAEWRVGCKYDFDKVAEMLLYYEISLTNWRELREQITLMYPKEKQKSYREITRQMHTRLYCDLLELKIQY